MKRDATNRQRNARVDSEQRQHDVELARKWIFTRGYPVSGKHVERVIGPTSLTPNRVRFDYISLLVSVVSY